MKRTRCTQEQIAFALRQADGGTIRGLDPRRLSAHERLRIMDRGGDPA